MKYLLGTDIGTSSVKTAVFRQDGMLMGLASKDYSFDIPQLGFAEQDPDVWWEAAALSVRNAVEKSGVQPSEIVCIGLSGQMHGLVPLGADGCSVRKAILHCDVRANKAVMDIEKRIGKNAFYDITYNPVFSGMQLVSLVWMRENEPDLFNQIDTALCPKDYVRYKLTGEIGVEATDASATLAYDMVHQQWSDSLIDHLGLPTRFFPEKIHRPYDIAGTITQKAAEKTGLIPGTPVVYGGSDQSMHSLGNGVLDAGTMMVTIGTSGQALMLSQQPKKNPEMNTHTFRHVNDDMWFGMGACLYAGVTLNWFKKTFLPSCSYAELDSLAEKTLPCSDGLVFFPAMSGERTPYVDMKTRGLFTGITIAHTAGHFVRAIMEGVSMELKQSIELLKKMYGEPKQIICAGGGSASKIWQQIQADIYGRPIHVLDIKEQACFGAAIVAGVGCGLFSDIQSGFSEMYHGCSRIIEPIPLNKKKYEQYYDGVFKQLYPQNKKIFHEMWNCNLY